MSSRSEDPLTPKEALDLPQLLLSSAKEADDLSIKSSLLVDIGNVFSRVSDVSKEQILVS